MRISRIKISGFKSFVDPTVLELPGNLTGVVGPNGCGKSNIIDALLWVLGESSAKHLRGDSMSDVIFNGSNTRKPVGQAAVEIIFDNSAGTLEGKYASYNEISIKRVLGRDDVSSYFLNGARCRRKDVIDVFLGTGVGKGGYSVIAQGTISRVIEAKPEEMRAFLEEAAGISRYKERRRETENRIKHAVENLDRVNDIRDELEKQLERLDRQVKAAERYQRLKAEERLARAQLLAIRWRGIEQERTQTLEDLSTQQNALEQANAQMRHIESDIATYRVRQHELTDTFNQVQSRYYATSAEISRCEQALQHAEQRREEIEQALNEARRSRDATRAHLETDTARSQTLAGDIATLEPALEGLREQELGTEERYARADAEMRTWQEAWDDFNSHASEMSRVERVEQVRLEHLEQSLSETSHRLQQLRTEQERLTPDEIEAAVNRSYEAVAQVERELSTVLDQRDQQHQALQDVRTEIQQLADALDSRRLEFQSLKGRIASLEQLQDAALNRDDAAVGGWLGRHDIAEPTRLAEVLRIEGGWERAVETVIRLPLDTFCNDSLEPLLTGAGHQGLPSRVTVLSSHSTGGAGASNPAVSAPLLTSKLNSEWPVQSLLAGVYAVDTVEQALAQRGSLAPHESLVCRDGTWVGPNWLQATPATRDDSSVLERVSLLDDLRQQADVLEETINQQRTAHEDAQARRSELEQAGREMASRLDGLQRRAAEEKSQLARQETQLEQVRNRLLALEDELANLGDLSETEAGERLRVQSHLEDVRMQMATMDARRAELSARREEIRGHVDTARSELAEVRARAHEHALRLENYRTQLAGLNDAMARNQQASTQLTQRCSDLEIALEAALEPKEGMNERLEQALNQQVALEEELGNARQALEANDTAVRDAEAALTSATQRVAERRETLDTTRLTVREYEVRARDLAERIAAGEQTLETLLAELDAAASEEAWVEMITGIENRINRLGPINLAAIDEQTQAMERKQYLDAQFTDLTQALDTLREAMQKIDRETRTRFKETFDKVNTSMQELFPTLFGGGHAYLELVGEDLLDTGVTVMARPPGKKNSTIHLLSGGEKALTAMAFVFSLFRLNPAPFCLLDEVDAPLDDANVVRYCNLVRSMSNEIQFVFITHNKVTMELAEQLVGVTMYEPGVSRLVSVDMDEAVQMAASA
ncbi:MAG: chromosome segregation protein SMC [Gammaproteobacteria bacterium]|nr:chromosome segregation protein SMC [Gammaproteobacteria bacterium]